MQDGKLIFLINLDSVSKRLSTMHLRFADIAKSTQQTTDIVKINLMSVIEREDRCEGGRETD